MTVQNPMVAFINESTVLIDSQVDAVRLALSDQVRYDFGPVWHTGCRTMMSTPGAAPATAWQLIILDNSDQAGALGYHDLTKSGLPIGKVFAKTDIDNNLSWSVTASHELLEMLADPTIDRCVQIAQLTFWALEVADSPESDQFAYDSNGVLVSDFVTPSWFGGGLPAPYDFKRHITSPHQILPGGYIGEWTPTKGWTQKTHRSESAPTPPAGSRRERRSKGRIKWRVSER